MQKKIAKFRKRVWKDVTDKELCDVCLSIGVDLTGFADEVEPEKYIVKDRRRILEQLGKRWSELLSEEALIISKQARWISVIAATASVASVVANILLK